MNVQICVSITTGKGNVEYFVFRWLENGIFDRSGTDKYRHIQITAADPWVSEQRGGYYETSGSLRIWFPNHLFQNSFRHGRNLRFRLMRRVRDEQARFYMRSTSSAEEVLTTAFADNTVREFERRSGAGYRTEEKRLSGSNTRPSLSIKRHWITCDGQRFRFYLRTGKRLETRVFLSCYFKFKRVPLQLFPPDTRLTAQNKPLDNSRTPYEGISLRLWRQATGNRFMRQGAVEMDFIRELFGGGGGGNVPSTGMAKPCSTTCTFG